MSNSESSLPKWFKTVAIVALVWNLIGAAAYIMQVSISEDQLALLPPEQQELYSSTPSWATAAFAIAVWAGLAGAIGLLMKKKWAFPAFALSLLGILIQDFHGFFMTNTIEVMGMTSVIFPIIVIAIAVYLVYLSNKANNSGWTT